MRILITGGKGMLARTLAKALGAHMLFLAARSDFDVADAAATHRAIAAFRPDAVLHCAAMTAVDRCETEADAAYRDNAVGSANVASACRAAGARLIAFSTDYVFSGTAARPYHEWDETGPGTVYGASKLAGETAIAKHCPDHLICRIAWLYGGGGPSFLHTMLRLGAEDGPPIKMSADQIGNPTSCDAVARHIAMLLSVPVCGIMHLTCEGEATWFDFAAAICSQWGLRRAMEPRGSDEHARPAKRPANSRLDKQMLRLSGLPPMPDWRQALEEFHASCPHG